MRTNEIKNERDEIRKYQKKYTKTLKIWNR